MNRVALDSSALAKRCLWEPGSDRVIELCAAADEVLLSIICLPEVLSGFNRLKREGAISSAQYRRLKRSLAKDLEQAMVADIAAPVLAEGIRCLETTPLRAMDAIHVGTAVALGCSMFVSADAPQCDAAEAMGLHVERIAL